MENHIEDKKSQLGEMLERPSVEPQKEEDKKEEGKKIAVSRKAIIISVIILAVAVVGGLAFRYKGLLVAATINGSSISRLAVISQLEKESGQKVLDALITQKLVGDEVQKKGITVGNDEVNAEIKTVEDQVKAQGETLDQALATQGMSMDDLKTQIIIRKKLEKLLVDKIQVTDAEVDKFIIDSKVTIPAGQEAAYKDQAKNQLKQQKLSDEAGVLINSLRSAAKIDYWVKY